MAQLTGGYVAFSHPTTETKTTAQHVLGARGQDTAGNEYRYVKFAEAMSAGGWVRFDGSWNAARVTATTVGALGVTQTSVAAADYGWAKVYGIEDVAQIATGDSAATSAYWLIAPAAATSEPVLSATAVTSSVIANPVIGARITAAASTATTLTSALHSGTTVQVFLNFPYLAGMNVDPTS